MAKDFLPLPFRSGDRIESAVVGNFKIVEAFHPPFSKLSPHAHQKANLTILMKGNFEETYRYNRQFCESASLLLRPAGEIHADKFGKIGAHNISVEIDSPKAEAIERETNLFSGKKQLRDIHFSLIGRKISRELKTNDTASFLALESLVLELFAKTLRDKIKISQTQVIPDWLKRVEEFLRENLNQSVTLKELALVGNVHSVHLTRTFKKHFRSTPAEYMRKLRIERSMEQLSDPKISLSQIALDSGFADQSHFTRTFKKLTGMTPNQFRQVTI